MREDRRVTMAFVQEPEQLVGHKFCVLVLEHHPVLALGLRRYLELLGHEVEIATGLAEGWVALGVRHFDVLLTDVYLPEGSCLLLLGEHPRLPQFVATMSGFDLDAASLRDLPVRRHLVKPFDPEELNQLLKDWADERALLALRNDDGGWTSQAW